MRSKEPIDDIWGEPQKNICVNHPERGGHITADDKVLCEECWEQAKVDRVKAAEEYREMMNPIKDW